ncbi:hypothetical protein ACFOQM_23405 [Paenibacillus sp. GCM10012307]|uniref:Uncharacterized protein n=1 Tax=Paenibacillus roseus TaxID=2798579 RepID=A0A934J3P7_9BACL|nr:hypothetical protein [Paenibacillus roseus]MBJ6364172.1 hypothetical protein [Paenibacillus roseus]
MTPELAELHRRITDKIAQLNKRISFRERPTYFDESERISRFHAEAYVYENVLKMIAEVSE